MGTRGTVVGLQNSPSVKGRFIHSMHHLLFVTSFPKTSVILDWLIHSNKDDNESKKVRRKIEKQNKSIRRCTLLEGGFMCVFEKSVHV